MANHNPAFLLEAFGQQAVEAGLHVAWFTLEGLGVLLRRHRANDSVSKAMAGSCAPISWWSTTSDLSRSEPAPLKGSADSSTPPTRNAPRHQQQPGPRRVRRTHAQTWATATVDRLLHHAQVCQTSSDSVRLTQALTGKGVPVAVNPNQPSVATPWADQMATTGQIS